MSQSPSPPVEASPGAPRPQRAAMSREEQSQAVADMEQAAADLKAVLEDTEQMGREEPALQRFESGVRELNQLNALKRASLLQEQHQEAEERGGWHASISDKVQRRGSREVQGDESEEEQQDGAMLGYYGGAAVTRRSSFQGRRSLADIGDVPPDVDAPEQFHRRTSATESMRIVGSLTPALLKARRASAGSRRSSAPGSFSGVPAPRRLSGAGLRGLGLCEAADMPSVPRRRSSHGVAAAPGDDTHFFQTSSSKGSFSRAPSQGSFRGQQDSSSTRVTGKIDYAALLNEQQDDLLARQESNDKYQEMLTQVQDYQKKMLEHLDSQLVFMGITEKDVDATAQELAEKQQAFAPRPPNGPSEVRAPVRRASAQLHDDDFEM
eukprot:TRINITY_DN12460_c1_g1_i1.p1 TRINITY_DN12460_c1_g1~~TRINITY_DN12460_c1_g1_i1.p1  ORF type:complete len:380 (+),score=148.22 TRINITY_DN12460_c1_g1_i1:129-1268(+)